MFLPIRQLIKKMRKDKVLVISWWWFRWLYAVWILKWLEDLGMQDQIKAVYGVSIGSIVWGLWCGWKNADEILNIFLNLSIDKFYGREIFTKTGWMLSNKKIKEMIDENIPESFSDLKKKLYVWTVDTNKAQYMLFESWDLHSIILGSMAIPGVFPPVKYKDYCFVDGWVLNNFPLDLAKKEYPYNELIWIWLNKFEEDQKIVTAWDNLMVCYQVMIKAQTYRNSHMADYLFYKSIDVPTLTLDKSKMKKAFDMGYKDCIQKFGKK